jgi:lipopolysaccharide/colanic/teichoic acid biosynthesis glycosyltransferase
VGRGGLTVRAMNVGDVGCSHEVDLTSSAQFFLDGQKAKAKRAEDLIFALVLLVITLPVMLVCALAIKLDSRGPVLFSQRRRGKNEKIIRIWKFRSMYLEASDELCRRQSAPDDPRVTRVGAFLRRHSLDELPQLFNVIRGEMSIVGPRPHALATSVDGRPVEDVATSYRKRYSVKPGITGWAQINGCRGQLDTIEKVVKRVDLDCYYIANWSLSFDIEIIVRSAPCMLKDDAAH